MKKIWRTALFLSIVLLFSACSSPSPGLSPINLALRNPASDTAILGDTVAIACAVNAPLSGIEIAFEITEPNASITVSVYQAEKDYKTSLANKPVRKETIDHLSEKVLWQFRTLAAGNYLIVFSDAKNAAPIKSVVPADSANGKTVHYRNGEVMTDGTCALTLFCIKTDQVPEPEMTTFFYPVVEE